MGGSCGFTLAEVLIVIGIIGLIADMTIPTLHQNITEKVTITKLQKIHSTFESAIRLAQIDNGPIETWDLVGEGEPQGALNLLNILANYLIINKNCNFEPGCRPDFYYSISGTKNTVGYTGVGTSAILSDGASIYIETKSANCTEVYGNTTALKNNCATVFVDINGLSVPNKSGVDFFGFNITKSGVIPRGIADDMKYNFEEYCNKKGDSTTSNGTGCTAWVLYNGNMDYLHCDDLSWTGKKKCK